MEIGWIDFSKTERDKINSILDLLTDPGTLDEMGIAQVRDGFSNLFFPGTTTIQTRAKYFLIVPYTLKDLELNSTKDYSKLKKELDDTEEKCARIFLENNFDESGVIGSRAIDQGNWVKRTPASIYWNGLRTYHIFKSEITLNQYLKAIASRKSLKENIAKLGNRNDNSDKAQDDKDAGSVQGFHFLNIPTYEKNWIDDLKMALTKEEGAFLKDQIINTCGDSLLGFIIKNNLKEVLEYESFNDLERISFKFPKNIRNSFRLAKAFSEFNFVLRIIYNIIASDGENERANERFAEKQPKLVEIADFDLKSVFSILKVRDTQLKLFLLKAQQLMKEEKIDELEDLITKREIMLKGENRSKTCHPGENGDTWLAGEELDYRFSIAKAIIQDIFDSEGDSNA